MSHPDPFGIFSSFTAFLFRVDSCRVQHSSRFLLLRNIQTHLSCSLPCIRPGYWRMFTEVYWRTFTAVPSTLHRIFRMSEKDRDVSRFCTQRIRCSSGGISAVQHNPHKGKDWLEKSRTVLAKKAGSEKQTRSCLHCTAGWIPDRHPQLLNRLKLGHSNYGLLFSILFLL